MYDVTTFLVVAVITVAFTKVATGALIATGVPPASAAFQARSAFSGAWFYIQRHVMPSLDNQRDDLLVLSDEFAIQSVCLIAPIDSARSLRGLEHAIPDATGWAIRRGKEFIGASPVDIDVVEGDELIRFGRRLEETAR